MAIRKATAALLAAAAFGAAACGDDNGPDQIAEFATAPQSSTTTETTAEKASSGESIQELQISKDLTSKPEIPKPAGDPPDRLYTRDIVKGTGKTAKTGDKLTVQYVGVDFDTAEQFDSSWEKPEPLEVDLGKKEVIPGWERGLPGMRVGGRRLLVIPPELAYKDVGQGTIGPNATLVFAIDLKSIG
ncbi:MAG: FKBP-type peptidyl-prolyl cis-trans isomerase [Solirubrobacteraceae bacterium]